MMIEQLKILNYVELHTQHTSLVGGDGLRFSGWEERGNSFARRGRTN